MAPQCRSESGSEDVTTQIAEQLGTYHLCACGHAADNHKPACHCRCPAFEDGKLMLACGHPADDDNCDPAYLLKMACPTCHLLVWPTEWEADDSGTFAVYDHCAITWTQGHDFHLPRVRVKRVDDERWVIDCPYCGREHTHGAAPGDRVSHCHKGDYVIQPLARRRSKLPYRTVWDRDGWECVTCGTHKDLTVDHIMPVSKGGSDDLGNLQTMCRSCNSRKGNRV